MKRLFIVAVLPLLASGTGAAAIYSQAPNPAGGSYQSSAWAQTGSEYDQLIWDGFTLGTSRDITQIAWRGSYGISSAALSGFTISIYPSIMGGSEPYLSAGTLVQYTISGNSGETLAGTYGGASMYDYQYTLPTPFFAQGGTKYWLQIVAEQQGIPGWGLASGTGGDGTHFLEWAGTHQFSTTIGDTAFTLVPEPTTYALATGLVLLGFAFWRRRITQQLVSR